MVEVSLGTVSCESSKQEVTQNVMDKLKALGYPTVYAKNGLGDKAKSFVAVPREG